MRFYTNYYDNNLPRAGTYAVPIGAYYGDVFDVLGNPNPITGYTAIEKNGAHLPESTTAMSGAVSNWLNGYLGLNPRLSNDPNYWPCSPAFLTSSSYPVQINGVAQLVQGSWPLSQDPNGSNQKQDVPLTVGAALPNGSVPYVDSHSSVSNPLCIQNGPATFQAGANNGTSTKYIWDGVASSEGADSVAGNPPGGPCGDINLTQQEATNAFGNTTGTMTSGYVTASFPYNIFVTGVAKQTDSGSTATYGWNVYNQTPLWLHGITVRVYTRGETTGKYTLQDTYSNIDMPPAMADGSAVKAGTQTKSFYYTGDKQAVIVSPASGAWSVAQSATYSVITKPNESYDVIVTANVELNTPSGNPGQVVPVIDNTLTAEYYTGAAVPGVPSREVKDYGALGHQAATILGLTTDLAPGYNDNVASANNNTGNSGGSGGNTPPPPLPTSVSNNLAAVSLTQPTSNSLQFTFNSNIKVGGNATVRFYTQSGSYLNGVGSTQIIHIAANGTASASLAVGSLTPGAAYYASVDATSSNGSTWTGYQFPGDDGKAYWEGTNATGFIPAAYYDNYSAYVVATPTPPAPIPITQQVHPTTYQYQPVTSTLQYQPVTTPIMGWKMLLAPLPATPKLRERLVF
jgi:hypothetical protein